MIAGRMRIACCILKATNTHSQYVTLFVFPLQQWLHERASMLRHTHVHCLSCFQSATIFQIQPDSFQAPGQFLNPLTPNDLYMSRTAPLTSKRCILYIYSTNIGTEHFKHALYSPFFSSSNAVCFIMLTSLVPVLFTFYVQVC